MRSSFPSGVFPRLMLLVSLMAVDPLAGSLGLVPASAQVTTGTKTTALSRTSVRADSHSGRSGSPLEQGKIFGSARLLAQVPTNSPSPNSPTPTEAGVPIWFWLLPLGLLGLLVWWLSRRSTPTVEPWENASGSNPPSPQNSSTTAAPFADPVPPAIGEGSVVAHPTPVVDPIPVVAEVSSIEPPSGELPAPEEPSQSLPPSITTAATTDPTMIALDPESTIVLTETDGQQVRAEWNASPAGVAALQNQGGQQLALRLLDVTNLDLTYQSPFSYQQFDLDGQSTDRVLPVPAQNRNYIAEIGYLTTGDRWLALARSNSVWVADEAGSEVALTRGSEISVAAPTPPEPPTVEPSTVESPPVGTTDVVVSPRSTIGLTLQSGLYVLAHWNIPEEHKAELRSQGGQAIALRLYDVTNLDLTYQSPYSYQQFNTNERTSEQRLLAPLGDRNYLAEIGYLTLENDWLTLARSTPLWVPAEEDSEEPVAFADAAPVSLPGADALAGSAFVSTGVGTGLGVMSSDRAQSDVEAAKFDVGQPDLSSEALADVDAGLELPIGYGDSRITLMPRDPQWAYAYWDVPNEHREAVRRAGGQRLALRLYDITDIDLALQSPHSLQQYDCEEMARDWYVPIPVSDRDYVAELGYLTADGNWLLLARSNSVRIPPVYPSDWFEEQFLTLPWEEELDGRTFLELTLPGQQTRFGNPLYDEIFDITRSADSLRVAGSLYGSMQHIAGSVPPGSAQMLGSQVVSSYVFPSGAGMWAGAPTPSGMGMSGIGISGIGLSGMGMSGIGMSGMGMSGIGMSGIGFSASMPPVRARKFWLIADAELIVYGATEPDAQVTIGGRPITLNPDGTFRFQMSFQDGVIDFPILAIAADGEQSRAIHMNFNRQTPYRQTNTKEEAQDEPF